MSHINHLLNSDEAIPSTALRSCAQRSPMSSDDELVGTAGYRENQPVPGSTLPTSPSDVSTDTENDEHQRLLCQWDACGSEFSQPELLYHHLCQDHVGRKSQRNLQLNCHWGSCTTKTVKRDHITSHLRVHVPLKPFSCSTCSRKFKRPQDLKKHLKVHMEDTMKERSRAAPGSRGVRKTGVNKGSALQEKARTLPNLTVESFVSQEMQNYYPYYKSRQHLDETLSHIILPPPAALGGTLASEPPSYTRKAVSFFTTLSQDMSRRLPSLAPCNSPGPAGKMVMLPRPEQQYARVPRYPAMPELPPLVTSPGAESHALPRGHNFRPAPLIPGSMLPSLSRFSHDKSQFVARNSYSLNQKASLNEELCENELDIALENLALDDTDALRAELQTVNIIKDYLTCLLLEDVYTESFELPASVEKSHSTLRKYPQIKV
ncbi:AFR190Cp [Eremothecium gossypii ATCC 10895]|uniref:pH-response transcription factor pacC/RIM101 n=1 Tax=Eremothecium gossypii (strain ATCC 10895 / CBS 109.51 / FGSC 9923 / NRRL Y-1056) TaxID=284811 RepID=PACC_EREGS|nr:AFR190Cp [Eremothecium gossypii ATCC 10895]Q753Y2.1 RecName: Full=pH-response transcription factor pacC/RIM101 [Eremothecium gossypii ATCC 10895]AAS53561.1 AFR190Cp [Eremothecium gossypii ATCC 10895]AEY97874.1 FAFR190Cp [Eremothecium gossypii FDAG1]